MALIDEPIQGELTEREMKRRIKSEKRRLMELLEPCDDVALEMSRHLIEQAAFLAVKLDATRYALMTTPAVVSYSTNTGEGTKKNPAYDAYTSLLKTYQQVVKQLQSMLPKTNERGAVDELAAWAESRR